MSGNFALITSGFDLQEEHIAAAIGSRDETKAVLARLSAVSAPDTGIAKVLLVYARMATTACEWLDGDLCVDLMNEPDGTSVHAFTELGGGLRERIFAALPFRAPLAEFTRSISRVPHMISPLVVRSTTPRRIRLSATELIRRTTVPPPMIAISAESLYLHVTSPALPNEVVAGVFELPLPVVGERAAKEVREPDLTDARGDGSPANCPGPSTPPKPAATSEPPLSDLDQGWDD